MKTTRPELTILPFRLVDENADGDCLLSSMPQLPGEIDSFVLHKPEEWNVADVRIGRDSIFLDSAPIAGEVFVQMKSFRQPFQVGQAVQVFLHRRDRAKVSAPLISALARIYVR